MKYLCGARRNNKRPSWETSLVLYWHLRSNMTWKSISKGLCTYFEKMNQICIKVELRMSKELIQPLRDLQMQSAERLFSLPKLSSFAPNIGFWSQLWYAGIYKIYTQNWQMGYKADLCHPEWQLEYLENGMRWTNLSKLFESQSAYWPWILSVYLNVGTYCKFACPRMCKPSCWYGSWTTMLSEYLYNS